MTAVAEITPLPLTKYKFRFLKPKMMEPPIK